MPGDPTKTVDWDEALTQVGGDKEFLDEVLQDLKGEAQTAKEEIEAAIEVKNFDVISKSAHRIKGSASYCCCEPLRLAALTLQEAGHSGTLPTCTDPVKLLADIKVHFVHFNKILNELFTEIQRDVDATGSASA